MFFSLYLDPFWTSEHETWKAYNICVRTEAREWTLPFFRFARKSSKLFGLLFSSGGTCFEVPAWINTIAVFAHTISSPLNRIRPQT